MTIEMLDILQDSTTEGSTDSDRDSPKAQLQAG